MRIISFIFLLSLSASLSLSLSAGTQPGVDSSRNVIADYPQALQRAGIKKARCIFKDSRGFIWIGTENGLVRYDGINVDILQHDADYPNSLPHNTVVSITEDHNGHIWAGTLEGVAQIDPWSFNCRVFNKRLHNLDQDFDVKIYTDHDNKIWAYGSRGLDLFDRNKNRFIKVWQHNTSDRSGAGYINCVTDWKHDTLAVGTFDGAVLISKKDFGSRRIMSESHLTVIRVFADERKRLWLGTWGAGCFVADTSCNHFILLKPETERPGELANVITGIISTNYNHIQLFWISTLQGVYKVAGAFSTLSSGKTPAFTMMLNGFANNIIADDDEYIWAAGNGVSRFFAGSNFFEPVSIAYRGTVEDIQPLNINRGRNIAVMTWYATSGLVITDWFGKTLYRQPPQSSQDKANIGGIALDKYKRLWISSLSGIEILNTDFKPVYSSEKVPAGDKLSGSKTNDILINHDTVWIACYKKGIDLYDLSFHKLRTFLPGDASELADDYVPRLFADSRHRIWLCGNSRLYLYEASKGKFRSFNFNKDSTSFEVNSMAELPDGDLLIASSSGLYCLNSKNYAFNKITSPLIGNNDIIAVAVDANGDIWFINNEHLIWYRVKSRHFTLFGREDGLNTSGDLQWLRAIDQRHFFLAEDKQIVTFTPGGGRHNSGPVKLYFHDVQVNDSTLTRGSFARALKLKYNQNRINIGFGAINYIKPEQNLFAYQLTGVDDKWIYTLGNFCSYANLAPGKYTLRLKVENYAGVWSRPVSMSIVVAPPFWAMWWFRLLSFILFGAVLFIAIRYVLQRNLREKILRLEKEQAVEKERNRIASDMHDDLGSGLTKIAILSEVAKAQIGSPAHASANLDVISNASRELVDNLQDIIWVLNPKNDSLSSLALYIKEYAESFFEPAGLQYEFLCDNISREVTLSEEQRRGIFLAVKESCNNILKHAHSTKAFISLGLNHNNLIISISDNGCGFDIKRVGNFSNGLQNIRNRMGRIGGTFTVASKKDEGTSITLTAPL